MKRCHDDIKPKVEWPSWQQIEKIGRRPMSNGLLKTEKFEDLVFF